MAKGLRSRSSKVNKRNLRSKAFAPVEEERKQRLSAKLLELASKPSKTDTNAFAESNKEDKRGDGMAIDILGATDLEGIRPSRRPVAWPSLTISRVSDPRDLASSAAEATTCGETKALEVKGCNGFSNIYKGQQTWATIECAAQEAKLEAALMKMIKDGASH